MTELAERLVIAGDVVVDEEDEFARLRLDLAQDVVDGAVVMLLIEILAGRAAAARETASAHVLHHRDQQVTFALEEIAPRLVIAGDVVVDEEDEFARLRLDH